MPSPIFCFTLLPKSFIILLEFPKFGNKRKPHGTDLIKGIIVNVRGSGNPEKSHNSLIALLEELLSSADTAKKKTILSTEYGLIMTEELEGRLQTLCNLSQNIIEEERVRAVERMLKINLTKEQILSCGYTEEEYEKAEKNLFANA